jgi:KDO2-lipid IV(A) lauroyltransferase
VSGTLGYLAYRFFSGVFGVLPEPVVRRVGWGLGYAASFAARARFRMAVRHQRRALGGSGDPRRSARRAFALYGRYWAETFWLRPRRREEILARTDIVDIEYLHDAVASDRGLILALPHMGNWEIAGLRGAAEGARVLAVAERLPNRRIVEWFTRQRAIMDIDVVIARRGVSQDLRDRLTAGGTVALLSDRDLNGRGIPVVLFGEATTLPAGPVALALQTGATVLPVGTYFREGAGHTFVIHPPLDVPEAGADDERVRLGTQRLAGVLEEIIRAAPEQWHLLQPNWPSDREEQS